MKGSLPCQKMEVETACFVMPISRFLQLPCPINLISSNLNCSFFAFNLLLLWWQHSTRAIKCLSLSFAMHTISFRLRGQRWFSFEILLEHLCRFVYLVKCFKYLSDSNVCSTISLICVAVALNTRKMDHWQREGLKGTPLASIDNSSINWRNYRLQIKKPLTLPLIINFRKMTKTFETKHVSASRLPLSAACNKASWKCCL